MKLITFRNYVVLCFISLLALPTFSQKKKKQNLKMDAVTVTSATIANVNSWHEKLRELRDKAPEFENSSAFELMEELSELQSTGYQIERAFASDEVSANFQNNLHRLATSVKDIGVEMEEQVYTLSNILQINYPRPDDPEEGGWNGGDPGDIDVPCFGSDCGDRAPGGDGDVNDPDVDLEVDCIDSDCGERNSSDDSADEDLGLGPEDIPCLQCHDWIRGGILDLIDAIRNIRSLEKNIIAYMELPKMSQNYPNPVIDKTKIDLYVPKSAKSAEVVVWSKYGKKLYQTTVEDRGLVSITVTADELPEGVHVYTASIDEREVERKRIVKESGR